MKKNVLFILLLIIFSCKEEQEIPLNNNSVEVQSLSSEVLTSGGVTLTGAIKNVELDLDYGFIIYSYATETPSLFYAELLERNTGLFNGNFSITFHNNLFKDHKYYYRAFAYTSNRTIFGEEQEFISSGSILPIINKVEPSIAHINDTITISGKNFSDHIDLEINTNNINILSSNDSLINFVVPNYPINRPYDAITVRKRTGEEASYNQFAIYIPEVHSIIPNPAYETDTLTFIGNHFDLRKDINQVYNSNNYKMEIIESTRTTLKIKLPGSFNNTKPSFKLRAQNTEIDVIDKLDIVHPKITELPATIKYNTPFTIKGTNFPGTSNCRFHSRFNVRFEFAGLVLEECYRDSLSLVLSPYSVVKDFYQDKIKMTYFDVESEYSLPQYIDEPIIKVLGSYLDDIHVYNGDMYTYSNHFNYEDDYIAKFDESEKDFILKDEYKIEDKTFTYSFIKGFYKDTYYSVKYIDGESVLLGYNFITKKLTRLKEVPGKVRFYGFIKGYGDYLYFGLGSFTSFPAENFSDVLRYSIKDNTWENFAQLDFPDISESRRDNPLVFFLNNSIYIGAGNRSKNDLYAIDLDTRQITKKKSLPFNIENGYQNSFVIKDNKLLFFKNSFYEYNPNLDEWKVLDGFKNESIHNLYSFKHMIIYKDEIYGFDDSFYKFNNNYF